MKKLMYLLFSLGIILMIGCTKEDQEIKQVTFSVNISDFNIERNSFKGKTVTLFDGFEHQYPINSKINFISSSDIKYNYNTGDSTLEEYLFTLPVGTYSITGSGGGTDDIGLPQMCYTIEEQSIEIIESTTQIDITLTPGCACVIVSDQEALLSSNELKDTYPSDRTNNLYTQNDLLYSYIYPKNYSDNSMIAELILWKKDNSTFDCLVTAFDIGYEYHITVTSGGSPTNLTPDFSSGSDITF